MRSPHSHLRKSSETVSDEHWIGRIELLIHTAKSCLRGARLANRRHWVLDSDNDDANASYEALMAGAGDGLDTGGADKLQFFTQCMDVLVRRIEAWAANHAVGSFNHNFLMGKAAALKKILDQRDDLDSNAIEFHLNILLLRLLTFQ